MHVARIREPKDNALEFQLNEGKWYPPSNSARGRAADPAVWEGPSQYFRVFFRRYVAYAVIDESYAAPEDGVEREVLPSIEQLDDSSFLTYLSQVAIFPEELIGPVSHYRFNCLTLTSHMLRRR